MRLAEVFRFMKRADILPTTTGIIIPSRTEYLSEDSALSLINVYRAVDVLVIAGKQLTMDVWRGRERLTSPAIIRNPDIDSQPATWIAENISSLALSGNAFWRVTPGPRGPLNAKVLDPNVCQLNKDGTLNHKGNTIPRGEFRHLKLMPRAGHTYGLGPIQAARAELLGAVDLRNYASEWFVSGDVPSGVLKSDQHLTKDQADGYKAQWEARNAHGVAVLGAGLGYQPILLKPEDAQFVQARQYTKTYIATLFGIPARMMLASVEGGSMTYANIAQDDLTFVRWTLMNYLSAIEEAMSAILPGHQTSRFNLDGILRPDTTTRYKAHKTALEAGFMTIDEVRAIEGLPPMEGITS